MVGPGQGAQETESISDHSHNLFRQSIRADSLGYRKLTVSAETHFLLRAFLPVCADSLAHAQFPLQQPNSVVELSRYIHLLKPLQIGVPCAEDGAVVAPEKCDIAVATVTKFRVTVAGDGCADDE